MKINNKVLAVVVSFNGGMKTISTINALIEQVDFVFVVDNASDEKSWQLLTKLRFDNLIIRRFDQNMGVGFALNVGKRKAAELECDWLLTMDQDSIADCNMLNVYQTAILNDKSLVCLSPCIAYAGLPLKARDSILDFCITSGNLIRMDVLNCVGDYDESLFIDGVDIDYCLRMRSKGFIVKKLGSALLHHQLGDVIDGKRILQKFYLKHSPQRHYYMYRNHFHIASKYFTKYPFFVAKLTIFQLLHLLTLFLYEDSLYFSLRSIFDGVSDFFLGRSGENARSYGINK